MGDHEYRASFQRVHTHPWARGPLNLDIYSRISRYFNCFVKMDESDDIETYNNLVFVG